MTDHNAMLSCCAEGSAWLQGAQKSDGRDGIVWVGTQQELQSYTYGLMTHAGGEGRREGGGVLNHGLSRHYYNSQAE